MNDKQGTPPWVAVVVVCVLAAIALVTLRALAVTSRKRLDVQRNLAFLADSQAEHHRRFGTYAPALGDAFDSLTVRLRPDSGTIIRVTSADSNGWTATGTHPVLHGRNSNCYIFGGAITHDPRLLHAGEPRCW
jgi:hypothetical protein